MKFIRCLSLLYILGATFALAQIQPETFKHIIIVVQENRTPDNLFGAAPSVAKCGVEDPMKNIDQTGDNGYADLNAPDVLGGNVPPLGDFFQLPLNQPRPFKSVSISDNPWPYTCFMNWNCNGVRPYVPEDPDEY